MNDPSENPYIAPMMEGQTDHGNANESQPRRRPIMWTVVFLMNLLFAVVWALQSIDSGKGVAGLLAGYCRLLRGVDCHS